MAPSNSEREFERLLEYLKRNRGFDFTGYKRPSLARRIEKRMGTVGVDGFQEYVDFLEVHPEEFPALFNTVLINVTRFFRDENAWAYLADDVLPELLARRKAGEVRVWSAGCASGEEAFTIMMLLAERLGAEAFRQRVKIYATDIDEEALTRGRHGTYIEREVADVPEKLRKRYFESADGVFTVRKDLRRSVIFGRHDLITDAPISRVDLLVCRNTLMYLNAETQAKILARFHFALNEGGILFLGRAETLLTHANTFQPVDLKRRISMKVPAGNLNFRDRLLLLAHNPADERADSTTSHFRLREVAQDAAPVAQIIVDANGALAISNERARSLFNLSHGDEGRRLQDLSVSYRPAELVSLIDQAHADRRPVLVRDVEWQTSPGDVHWFDIHVVPLFDAGMHLGTSVAFTDVSGPRRLLHELDAAKQELGAAYEELQSTNEEPETTNEELQSTVEELETTNEELQSTNEELETMNEELHSTNEELQTLNDELQQRGRDLDRVNSFMESILGSIRGGVVVVDRDMHIQVWNRHAHDLWGLLRDEVEGKHLLGLDIGLPVASLKQPVHSVLGGHEDTVLELDGTNRRGKTVRVRVAISALRSGGASPTGAILVMEELEPSPRTGPEKE